MKYNELLRKLQKEAGAKVHREGANHTILDVNGKLIPIPRHGSKEVPTGTLKQILKAAGLK